METPQKAAFPNHNKLSRPIYQGERGAKVVMRPGSTDLLKVPSRFGNNLHYPDGHKEIQK